MRRVVFVAYAVAVVGPRHRREGQDMISAGYRHAEVQVRLVNVGRDGVVAVVLLVRRLTAWYEV